MLNIFVRPKKRRRIINENRQVSRDETVKIFHCANVGNVQYC